MTNKKQSLIISAVFITFVAVFFIMNIIIPNKRFSQMENRILAQMPKISIESILSGEFSEDFETYITDQFLGRDFFIKLKSTSELVLGKQENSQVYLAEDQTLIGKTPPMDETRIEENIEAINRLGVEFAIPVYFALIPTSGAIWNDKLPAGVPCFQQRETISQIYDQINVKTVNIYDQLDQHKNEAVYYRTDHHWTSLGAYYGYVAFMEAIGESPIDINLYEQHTVTKEFYGTLYSKTGAWWIPPDKIDTYVNTDQIKVSKIEGNNQSTSEMYQDKFLEKKDKYSYFMGGNQPLVVIENIGNMRGPQILIIRDSYMDSQLPFFTEHYSKIHVVDYRFYKGNVVEYAKKNQIDLVFISYGIQNFVGDRNLKFIEI